MYCLIIFNDPNTATSLINQQNVAINNNSTENINDNAISYLSVADIPTTNITTETSNDLSIIWNNENKINDSNDNSDSNINSNSHKHAFSDTLPTRLNSNMPSVVTPENKQKNQWISSSSSDYYTQQHLLQSQNIMDPNFKIPLALADQEFSDDEDNESEVTVELQLEESEATETEKYSHSMNENSNSKSSLLWFLAISKRSFKDTHNNRIRLIDLLICQQVVERLIGQ